MLSRDEDEFNRIFFNILLIKMLSHTALVRMFFWYTIYVSLWTFFFTSTEVSFIFLFRSHEFESFIFKSFATKVIKFLETQSKSNNTTLNVFYTL